MFNAQIIKIINSRLDIANHVTVLSYLRFYKTSIKHVKISNCSRYELLVKCIKSDL